MVDAPSLVADIGGTQARLALAQGYEVLRDTVWTTQVSHHATPEAMIAAYLDQVVPRPVRAVLALAGPVAQGQGRLTNGDWRFDAAGLGAMLGLPVRLINDLAALGLAAPHLRSDQVHWLAGAPAADARQGLVVGVGTGFNLAPVVIGPQPAVVACEYGHLAPSVQVLRSLGREVATIEDAFSGRGFSALNDPPRFARALGVLVRELRVAFQPDGGLWLAGRVARAVLDGPACSDFLTEATGPCAAPAAAIAAITDDAAALGGCARA